MIFLFQAASVDLSNSVHENVQNPFAYHYRAITPVGLDIDNILQRFPPSFDYHMKKPNLIRANLLYIVNLVVRSMEELEGAILPKPNGYVPLNAEALKGIISNYSQYLSYLIERNILITDQEWSSKSHTSKGFKLAPWYETQLRISGTRTEYIYEPQFMKGFAKRNKPTDVIHKYQHLYNWLSCLTFDKDEAHCILNSLYNRSEDRKKANELTKLYKLFNESYWTFKTGGTNRLYTPVTSIKKELRQTLRCNGEILVEIDVKNCLPFISLIFFNEDIINKYTSIIKTYAPYLFKEKEHIKPYYMLQENDRLSAPDVLQFKQDIISSEIYSKIRLELNRVLGKTYSIKEAKKMALQIFNSPAYYTGPEKEVMRIMYPTVIDLVDLINGNFCSRSNQSDKTKTYKLAPFAYITQKIESLFILDNVCSSLAQNHPEAPIFTIHDAVLSTPSNAGFVEEKLLSESQKMFGVACKVESTYY